MANANTVQAAQEEIKQYRKINETVRSKTESLGNSVQKVQKIIKNNSDVDHVTHVIAEVQKFERSIVDCLLSNKLQAIPELLNDIAYDQKFQQHASTVLKPFSDCVQQRISLVENFKRLQADVYSIEDNQVNLTANSSETQLNRLMRQKLQQLVQICVEHDKTQVKVFEKGSDGTDREKERALKEIASKLRGFGDNFQLEVTKGAIALPKKGQHSSDISADAIDDVDCDGSVDFRGVGALVQDDTIDRFTLQLQEINQLLAELDKATQ